MNANHVNSDRKSSAAANPSGTFVVLEGIDGSGTTTQAHRLVAAAKAAGREALFTCEPSTGPIGVDIRARLSAAAPTGDGWSVLALLFAADRLEHVANEIAPALARGALVVCDRYVLSSLVYQGLHVDEAWVHSINSKALAPDLTILVDVDPDEAARRRAARGGTVEIYDADETQRMLADRYRSLSPGVDAVVVDGNLSIDAVTAQLEERISALTATTAS